MNHGKKWKFNIESSLNVPNVIVEVMEEAIDHWVVDIKDMNPVIYKAYTGKDNDSVIKNLQFLINKNAKITVRVPIISGFNTESDVEKSVLTLQQMGIKDIERFTYTIREH